VIATVFLIRDEWKGEGMKGVNERVCSGSRAVAAGCVLAAGIFADNALTTAIRNPGAAWVFPVICGLGIGSLTVLTYMRYSLAYTASAALFSALTVIVLTLTQPRVEHIVLLTLCVLTTIVCVVVPPVISSVPAPVPVPVRIEGRDERR